MFSPLFKDGFFLVTTKIWYFILYFWIICWSCGNYAFFINPYELAAPGDLIFGANYQLYNAIVTAHAFVMNFLHGYACYDGGFGNWLVPLLMAHLIWLSQD